MVRGVFSYGEAGDNVGPAALLWLADESHVVVKGKVEDTVNQLLTAKQESGPNLAAALTEAGRQLNVDKAFGAAFEVCKLIIQWLTPLYVVEPEDDKGPTNDIDPKSEE